MLYCPNYNSQGWRNMDSKLGSDLAHYYFYLKGGDFLTDKEITMVLNKEKAIDNPQVNYKFKGVDNLVKNIDKANRLWSQIKDKDLFWTKIQKDLQIPKDQIELLKISEGNTLTDKILDFANNYSYAVEINTAKSGTEKDLEGEFVYIDGVDFTKGYTGWYKEDSQQNKIPATPEELIKINKKVSEQLSNTQDYANMVTPGGVNYKELRFTTPLITPSIKGHARFAQDNDIGWARVDDRQHSEKVSLEETLQEEVIWDNDGSGEELLNQEEKKGIVDYYGTIDGPKTLRVQEIQSDLFQKGRDNTDLVTKGLQKDDAEAIGATKEEYGQILKETRIGEGNEYKNQFLQLLNKDNNWVTFFIKSLIQDSIKKGYEKVLFPRLDTIIQIESQNKFKTYKEAEAYYKDEKWFEEDKKLRKVLAAALDRPKEQQNQEHILRLKEQIASHQPSLLHTASFYEFELANRLDDIAGGNKNNRAKGIWALNQITDEYGNTWNEITLDNLTESTREILLNIGDKNKDNIDKELRSKYFYDGDVQKTSVILERIAKSKHPLNKLAKYLQKYNVSDPNINLLPGSMVSKTGIANFDPNVNEINIAEFAEFKDKSSSEPTLLHEVLHSITYDEIYNEGSVISDFRMLYNYASLYKSSFNDQYPFKDLHEFLVAIFTNSDFIKTALKIPPIDVHNKNIVNLIGNIIESSGDTLTVEEAHEEVKQLQSKLFREPSGRYNNLWENILHWIASLFKITPDSSLYNDIFNISTNIIENQYQRELKGKEYNDYYRSIDSVPFNEGLQSKENPLNKLAKELGIYKKQLSQSQTINVKKNVEEYNKKNGRSLFVEFKRMGQADLFTWNIVDKAGGQTKMFSISNIKNGVSEVFESNPELANAVYEALGFTNTKTQIAQVKNNNLIITQYSDESFDVVPDKEGIAKRTQEIKQEYKENLKLVDKIIKDFEQGKNVFSQSDNISTIVNNASREFYFNYSTDLKSFVIEEFNGDEQFASGDRKWNPKIYDKIEVRNGIEAGQIKIAKSKIVDKLKEGIEKKKKDALYYLEAWESQEGIDRTKKETKYYYDISEFDERGFYNKGLVKSKKGYTLRNLEGGALSSIPGSQGAIKGYGYYHNRIDRKQPDAHIFIDRIDETGVYIRYITVQKEFQGKGIASIMLNRVRQDYSNLPIHRTLIINPIIVKQSANIQGATDLKGNPLPKFKNDQEIYDWLDDNDHIILPPLNNQITPQQKQQAQQLYSQYLNNIFPDSKVKDIVYHGTPAKNITRFNIGNIYFTNEPDEAFNLGLEKFWTNLPSNIKEYFLDNTTDTYKNSYGLFEWTLVQARNKKNGKRIERGIERHIQFLQDSNIIDDNFDFNQIVNIYPSILNIKDPNFLKEDERFFKDFKKGEYTGDGIIGKDVMPFMSDNRTDTVYLVFEPEQIHILGSKQDIEGFKSFIDDNKNNQSTNLISSEQFKESETLTNKQLEDKLKEFLERFNIKVEVVDKLKLKGIDVNGFADILNNLIKLDKSKSDTKVFTEEVAHFAVEILGDDHPYIKALMKLVDKTDIYKQVKKDYALIYRTEEEFKKEAIGKLLVDAIFNEFKKEPSSKLTNWLKAIYSNFLRFINTLTNNSAFKEEVNLLTSIIAQNVLTNTIKQGNKPSSIKQLASIPTNEEEALKEIQATLQNRFNQIRKQGKSEQYPNMREYRERINYLVKDKTVVNRIISAVNVLNDQINDDVYKFLSKDPANPGFIQRLNDNDKSFTVTTAIMNEIKYFTNNYTQAINEILGYLEKTNLFDDQKTILKNRLSEIQDINRVFNNYEAAVLENMLLETFEGYEIDPNVTERRASARQLAKDLLDTQTKDATWFRTFLGSPRLSSNKVVRAIVNKINQYLFVVQQHTNDKINEFLPIYLKLKESGFDMNDLIEDVDGKLFMIGPYNFKLYYDNYNKFKDELAKKLGFNTFSEIDVDTLSTSQSKIYNDAMDNWRKANREGVLLNDKYKDPRYDKLISNPLVKEFIDAYNNIRIEDLKRLPMEYRTLETMYMLPQMTKGMIDVWAEKSGFKQYLKDKFNVTADEIQYGDSQIVTDYFGNEIKYIPVNYFNKVNNPSNDLFFLTVAFTEMSKNFEQMTIASADSEFLLNVVGKTKFKTGKKSYSGLESNIYKILEVFFETHIYKKSDQRLVINFGGKEIDITKLVQRIHSYVRKNNLAGQVVTMTSNVLKSDVDTIVEGVVGKAFSLNTYMSAKLEWAKNEMQIFSQMKSVKQNNKLHHILQSNSLFGDIKDKYHRVGLTAGERGLFSDSFWYNGYEMAEYRKTAIVGIAVMKDYKIYENKLYTSNQLKRKGLTKDEIEKLPTYYDNYDYNDGKVSMKIQLSDNEKYKVYNKVTYLTRTIDGKMEGIDKGAAYRSIVARFFLTHKNWLVSGIDRRFKAEQFNLATEENDIGYYKATARFIRLLLDKEVGKARGFIAKWNELSDAEKIGVQKTVGDIVFLAALFGLFAMFHALDDDDEPTANLAAYLSSRVLLEHSSFLVPTEIIEMFKTPFAAASSITRAQDLLLNFANFEDVDRGSYEGLPQNLKILIKMTPYIKQYWELPNPKDKDKFLLNTGLKPFSKLQGALTD